MDSSLLNKETDAGVFLEDFIYETNRVNKFFLQNLRNIRDELKQFKEKYQEAVKSSKPDGAVFVLNGHEFDLGYAKYLIEYLEMRFGR